MHCRLGDGLKTYRKQRGWTQAELAERATISIPTLRLLEQSRGNLGSLWGVITTLELKLVGRNLPDGEHTGARLALLRRRRKLSQRHLAQMLSISPSTLVRLERLNQGRFDVLSQALQVLGSGARWMPVDEMPKFFSHAGNSSGQQDWQTPPELLERLYTVFRFDLDPCSPTADKRRAPVKAKVHYTAADDGLSLPWFGTVFINPPYGRELRHWVAKGRNEVAQGNAQLVIALIPARTDTTWWHDTIAGQAEVLFLRGRLSFGCSGQSAPFPSAIAVWSHAGNVMETLATVFPNAWCSGKV